MIEAMLVDSVTFYNAAVYSDDAAGGPNISALGSGTAVSAHVGISNTNMLTDQRQEDEKLYVDILVLASDVTPVMSAVVLVSTLGRQTFNKYCRITGVELVATRSDSIPAYWAVTAEVSA